MRGCQPHDGGLRRRAPSGVHVLLGRGESSDHGDAIAVLCRFAPGVVMVQPAQTRRGNHRRARRRFLLNRTPMRCVLLQGVVNRVLVIIGYVLPNDSPQMFFVQRDHMIQDFSAAVSDPAFRQSILPGACTLVRFGFRPVAFRKVMNSPSNLESRSRNTFRYGGASGKASRSCWTSHAAVGCRVMLKWRILRRP